MHTASVAHRTGNTQNLRFYEDKRVPVSAAAGGGARCIAHRLILVAQHAGTNVEVEKRRETAEDDRL